jgi:hypothetical protein
MDTDHLIQQLADRAQPVARLLAPWRRTMLWLGASLLYVGIVVAAYLLAGGGLPSFIESRSFWKWLRSWPLPSLPRLRPSRAWFQAAIGDFLCCR